jgi:hypothetical protein
LNPTTPGDYYIIVSALDNFGCTYSDTIGVNYFAPPVLDLGNDLPYCLNSVNLTSNLSAQVAGINYVYDWSVVSLNGGAIVPNDETAIFSGATGTSEVSLSVHPIDDIQCTVTDNVLLITPETPPAAPLSTDSICIGENMLLLAPFIDSDYSYEWLNADGDSIGSGINFPSNANVPFTPFTYSVTIFEPICFFNSTSNFEVISLPCEVFLPNILTLNNDLFNEVLSFGTALQYFKNAELQVFSRWGDLVYESIDYKNDWSPKDLNDGVYYYVLLVTTPAGVLVTVPGESAPGFHGYFHLMRN